MTSAPGCVGALVPAQICTCWPPKVCIPLAMVGQVPCTTGKNALLGEAPPLEPPPELASLFAPASLLTPASLVVPASLLAPELEPLELPLEEPPLEPGRRGLGNVRRSAVIPCSP